MSIVELREEDPELVAQPVALVREAEDSELEAGMVAAGGGRKGKRAEYRCAACGYGIVAYGRPPGCPMCREARWEHVEWRPSSQRLDDLALPLAAQASDVPSTRLPRQRPRSRSATFARLKPEHRSKNDTDRGARAARLRLQEAGSSSSSPRSAATRG
jgi:hypothetical protein